MLSSVAHINGTYDLLNAPAGGYMTTTINEGGTVMPLIVKVPQLGFGKLINPPAKVSKLLEGR